MILARLACVRHAASVHPEPGSNSLKKISSLYDFKFFRSFKLIISASFTSFKKLVTQFSFNENLNLYAVYFSRFNRQPLFEAT